MGILSGIPFIGNIWGGNKKAPTPTTPATQSRGYFAGPTAPQTGLPSYQQALGYYQGIAAPQLAGIDLQQSQLRNQIGVLGQQLALGKQGLNQAFNLGNARVDLGQQGIDLQRQAGERDVDYYDRILNLVTNHYNAQQQQITRAADLYYQNFSGAWDYQDQVVQLADQLFGLQKSERGLQRDQQDRSQMSDATARGAVSSGGNRHTLQDIGDMYNVDVAQFQNQFMGTQQQASENKRQLANQYEQAKAQWDAQREDLTYGFNREQETLWHQQDASQDQIAMLDLKAQELGLQRQELANSLSMGIKQLQLSNTVNVNDLMAALASGDIQRMTIAQQVMNQALMVAGPPPPPPTQSAMNNSSGGGSYVKKGKAF